MALERAEPHTNESNLNCPVCLQPFEDKVILNNCFHAFCRFCILQWSEFEPAQRHGRNRCPLCRSSFSALFANYDDQSRTYDIQNVEETSDPHHWSAFYENKDAIEVQKWKSKTNSVVRKRRLLVYNLRLLPIIDFSLPSIGSERSLNVLEKRFLNKSSAFLSRELPILLLHDSMAHGLQSLNQQDRELSLLMDLIKALLPSAILPLAQMVHTRVLFPNASDWEIYDSLDVSSNHKDALNAMLDELEHFFESSAILLLRELSLFVMSPYTLGEFDERVTYHELAPITDNDVTVAHEK